MTTSLPPIPTLVVGTTCVRPWRLDDLACVQRVSAEGLSRGTTIPKDFTVESGQEWIRRQWSRYDDGSGWSWAIADAASDVSVGCIVLLLPPQAGVAGIGYWVLPEARRRGHAFRAITTVRDWALAAGGPSRVEAWVEPDNDASTAVLEHCGFHLEGRLRSFLSLGSERSDALVFSSITDEG